MTGFNHKIIAYQMTGQKLETPLIKKLKTIRNWILIALIGVAVTLSAITVTKWISFDTAYDAGVRDAYRAKNGFKDKGKSYAGASGEGRVMENKDGR